MKLVYGFKRHGLFQVLVFASFFIAAGFLNAELMPAQDPIVIFSEADRKELKEDEGIPELVVLRYEKGRLLQNSAWSKHSRRNGWQLSLSPSGQAIYVAGTPSGKPGVKNVKLYLCDALSGPDFQNDQPFYQFESKRTEPLAPGSGLSCAWAPNEKRFYVRRLNDVLVFENSKLVSTVKNVSWTAGTSWASSDSSLALTNFKGNQHWIASVPKSGVKDLKALGKPYIDLKPRSHPLFKGKVHSECFRVLYSPNGKYLAYAKSPGVRPLVNPSLNEVSKVRYNGPVTGVTSLRVGVRGRSVVVDSFENAAKTVSQEKIKNGFSGKTIINGEERELNLTQISPIGWSQQSDAFYYVVTRFRGKDIWSFSNRKKEGTFAKLVSNALWRTTPTGKKSKVGDLKYMPDWDRYVGNMASSPNTNEGGISSDGKHLLFWGAGTKYYRENLVKLKFDEINHFIPERASKFARYLIRVDLKSGKEVRIFSGSRRSRDFSIAGFVGSELKVRSLAAYDANPSFIGNGKRLPRQLLPSELIRAAEKRKGTTADGVSQLVVKAEVSAKVPVVFRVEDGDGKLEPLLDGKTVTLQGKHYAFSLYTPPKHFVGGSSSRKPSSVNDRGAQPSIILKNSTVEVDKLLLEAIPYRPGAGNTAQPVLSGRKKLELGIARPPAVLVHGLGSNPIECWVATKPNGQSMVIALEQMGIQPFCVNYEKSNGLHDPELPGDSSSQSDGRDSTYQSNRNVVWDSPDGMPSEDDFLQSYRWIGEEPETGWLREARTDQPEIPKPRYLRIGGIKQALEFYRNDLDFAATQADVIGHSMGGILSRVYAEPRYNPDYRRMENFNQGDIHRLITICTPHHGSELAMLYNEVFRNLVIDNEPFVQWARKKVQQKLLTMFLDPDAGAIRDLRYRSLALQRIGPTDIPSFAIATEATNIDLGNPHVDPTRKYLQLYSGIAMALFFNRPRLDAWIERRALRWSNAPEALRKNTDRLESESVDWSDEEARSEFRKLLAANIDANAYYWLKRREGAYRDQLYRQIETTAIVPFGYFDSEMGQATPEGGGLLNELASAASKFLLGGDVTKMHEVEKEPDVPFEVIGIIRALIFHNDSRNDGAVRTESQIGGNPAFEIFEGVVHSFAPWDQNVQAKVVSLLKWDDDQFFASPNQTNPRRFAQAGQLMPYWLPSISLASPYVYGEDAIDWSGMVESHAEQYLHLSEQKDVVIIARPVNHDSTRLIINGAATKGMDVKGKSANWGPQKGFIPRQQRFSKLWRVYADDLDTRKKKIDKFNTQTETMLDGARYPETADPPKYRGRIIAVPRILEVDLPETSGATARKKFTVMIDPDPKLDAEQAVFLVDAKGIYFDWRNAIDRQSGDPVQIFHYDYPAIKLDPQPSSKEAASYIPMQVIADNLEGTEPPAYLTADYDLLAIGFLDQGFEGPHPDVKRAMEDGKAPPVTGFISPPQLQLIREFNDRCRNFATPRYTSGNLTHHGPETQYPGSEYIDYPLLVFDPGKPRSEDDSDAQYFVIRQGPPGFRDVHLKNYFWEKKQLGHNIWPNPVSPGWLWEDENSLREYSDGRGYDPRDAAGLLKYVAPQKVRSQQISGIGTGGGNEPDRPDESSPDLDTLETAAQSGDSRSQFALAFALGKGELSDGAKINKDDEKAAYWYRRAALGGHKVAQYNLAVRLDRGRGVEENTAESAYWYLQSAKQGFSKSFTRIGYRFHYGKGIRKDYRQALKWYLKAFEDGNAVAANNLGVMFETGQGVAKDLTRARQYFEMAAGKDHALGTKNLGDLYYRGSGVKQDYAKALNYYQRAKKLGLDSVDDNIKRARDKLKSK